MKKVLCILLTAVLLFLCGCSKTENGKASEVFKSYLEKTDSFDSAVHEYGEEESTIMFGERLSVTVLYPKTDIASLDEEINNWIAELITYYQLEITDKEMENPAELTVVYNSYKSKRDIVSVEFTGTYCSEYLAHPEDIIKTFSADIKTEKTVELSELMSEKKRKSAKEIIMNEFGISEEDVHTDIFSQWVLTRDGLKIILPRGEFLPMSDGIKEYTFTKKETDELLSEVEIKESEEEEAQKVDAEIKEEYKKPETVKVDKTKPMVALTFDDGPSAHTGRLLDILDKYSAKGTFFVIGNTLDNRKDAVKRIVSSGHEIGGHSWSHRQFTNLSADEVKDQIMMTRAKIYEITGVDSCLVRPPYGAFNDSVNAVAKEINVSYINWSVDTLDWKSKNADAVYNEIMKDVSDGAIILCHDLHKTTVDAMERVIPALIEKGYQLVTVSDLLQCDGEKLESGKVYFNKKR